MSLDDNITQEIEEVLESCSEQCDTCPQHGDCEMGQSPEARQALALFRTFNPVEHEEMDVLAEGEFHALAALFQTAVQAEMGDVLYGVIMGNKQFTQFLMYFTQVVAYMGYLHGKEAADVPFDAP